VRPGWLVGAGLLAVLVGVNASIAAKERLVARGTPVLLELAPVDPRSLMQGDYMALRYRAVDLEPSELASWPRDGRLVLRLGPDGVGRRARVHRDGEPLAPGELLLRFRRRGGEVRLGAEAYFFQEGTASTYEAARYGELRVAADGASVLVGLRDAARRPLGPSRPR
jgi:uncharacterized membrane-anchored protein